MDDRALAWSLFLAAVAQCPSKDSPTADRIAADVHRADQLLAAYDKKFPTTISRASDRERLPAGTGSTADPRRGGIW